MSYDLFFLRRVGATPVPDCEILDYFERRPNYQVNRDARQVLYENDRTGVYFTFNFDDDEETGEDAGDGLCKVGLAFNLNYFRPHVFALEAEPELKAVVERFGWLVEDPQTSGMGRGEYRTEGFLAGWNHGNLVAYRIIASQEPEQFQGKTLPSREIHRIWDWNRSTANFESDPQNDVFVPRIMLFRSQDRILSMVAWGDAIPIALPKVDVVFVARQQLASRRWLGLLPGKPEFFAVTWGDMQPMLACGRVMGDLDRDGHVRLAGTEVERQARAFFLEKRIPARPGGGLSLDSVLDDELVRAALEKS